MSTEKADRKGNERSNFISTFEKWRDAAPTILRALKEMRGTVVGKFEPKSGQLVRRPSVSKSAKKKAK